jgi:hypothetical protein
MNIEGFEVEVIYNAVRKTHRNGCAGYFKIKVNGVEREVFGTWDNEYETSVIPWHVETLIFDGMAQINEPEISIVLAESDDEDLTAEMVARELAALEDGFAIEVDGPCSTS